MALEITEQLIAVSDLLNELKSQNILPPLPRWASTDLSSFIEGAILRFPIQLVVLDNRKGKQPSILIGTNRIGALYWFLDGCFPLDPAGLDLLKDIGGKRIHDVGPYRVLLEGRPLRVGRVQSGSDEDVALLVRKLEARASNRTAPVGKAAPAPTIVSRPPAPAIVAPGKAVVGTVGAPAAPLVEAAVAIPALTEPPKEEDWIREEDGQLVLEVSEDAIGRMMAGIFGFMPHANAVRQAMEKMDGDKIGQAVSNGVNAGKTQVEAAREEITRQLTALGRPAPPISLPKL